MKNTRYRMIKLVVAAACLTSMGNVAAAEHDHREHAAHVHGEGRLTLAIEGGHVEITLDSPAESIIGFEHAPENDKEKAQLTQAIAHLRAPETLFRFDAAAQCVPQQTKVESPFDNKDAGEHPKHADVEAEYTFECLHPQKIKQVLFPLLSIFPALKTLDVDYVTESTQGNKTLNTNQQEIVFP